MATLPPAIPSVERLAEFLTSGDGRQFAVFVGSFISCAAPARAPSVDEIRRTIKAELLAALDQPVRVGIERTFADPVVQARWESVPFESLWERIGRVTGAQRIQSVLAQRCSGGAPNHNHRAIAWLAKAGHVHTVLTTNYDEYCEEAEASTPLLQHQRLHPDDSMVMYAPLAGARLIKLHGTLSQPDSMAFMFPQITAGFSAALRQQLREVLHASPVLFAGYGCNDWDLREPLGEPLVSVWATHREHWSAVDERCQTLAQGHRSVHWYHHNLSDSPEASVFVRLARHFGWKEELLQRPPAHAVPNGALFDGLDIGSQCEILAELLDSLAVRGASLVFARASRLTRVPAARRRLAISSLVALGHDMSQKEMIRRGKLLLRCASLSELEKTAVITSLAFTQFIGGQPLKGLAHTLDLWLRRCRKIAFVAPGSLQLARERWPAVISAEARHIVAHNLLRLAWFHVPGTLGALLRPFRRAGMRRGLAFFARQVLTKNEPTVKNLGDLARIANQAREKAHALCLTGEFGAALTAVRLSEEAYGWGKWYQWQANTIRSRGWIWLRIGEQYPALRSYADEQARTAFGRAYALAGEYVTQAGEMVDDRIKALLEIKRLAESYGDTFRWSRELEADLQVVAQRNPVAHSRYQAAAISSPPSREPLG
jgi:hypothetical protein